MSDEKQSPATPSFAGEFRHKVEGRNRITIPARWRFEEEVEIFLLPKQARRCITVLTRAELEKVKSELRERLTPDERLDVLETIGSTIRQTTLDKGGRITIPDEFCKAFKIAREVVLVGALDRFNIWSIADYEANKPADPARRDAHMRKAGL
ncbi:MAG TPA: hypothetical protein VEO95_01485 [Chthoniobacteraceae bacterium]|nr:hypothetical protein [Chthoniobacteraceae bacterium]